jgi:hypothetical protein
VLLAVDLHEDFIDVEGIAEAAVVSLQSKDIESAELDAPKPDRLSANHNSTLRQ